MQQAHHMHKSRMWPIGGINATFATITTPATKAGTMTDPDADDIEKRLDADEWLSVIEVTALLKPYRPKLSRTTVHRWLAKGRLGYRQVGNQRTVDPVDVRKELADARRVRRGKDA